MKTPRAPRRSVLLAVLAAPMAACPPDYSADDGKPPEITAVQFFDKSYEVMSPISPAAGQKITTDPVPASFTTVRLALSKVVLGSSVEASHCVGNGSIVLYRKPPTLPSACTADGDCKPRNGNGDGFTCKAGKCEVKTCTANANYSECGASLACATGRCVVSTEVCYDPSAPAIYVTVAGGPASCSGFSAAGGLEEGATYVLEVKGTAIVDSRNRALKDGDAHFEFSVAPFKVLDQSFSAGVENGNLQTCTLAGLPHLAFMSCAPLKDGQADVAVKAADDTPTALIVTTTAHLDSQTFADTNRGMPYAGGLLLGANLTIERTVEGGKKVDAMVDAAPGYPFLFLNFLQFLSGVQDLPLEDDRSLQLTPWAPLEPGQAHRLTVDKFANPCDVANSLNACDSGSCAVSGDNCAADPDCPHVCQATPLAADATTPRICTRDPDCPTVLSDTANGNFCSKAAGSGTCQLSSNPCSSDAACRPMGYPLPAPLRLSFTTVSARFGVSVDNSDESAGFRLGTVAPPLDGKVRVERAAIPIIVASAPLNVADTVKSFKVTQVEGGAGVPVEVRVVDDVLDGRRCETDGDCGTPATDWTCGGVGSVTSTGCGFCQRKTQPIEFVRGRAREVTIRPIKDATRKCPGAADAALWKWNTQYRIGGSLLAADGSTQEYNATFTTTDFRIAARNRDSDSTTNPQIRPPNGASNQPVLIDPPSSQFVRLTVTGNVDLATVDDATTAQGNIAFVREVRDQPPEEWPKIGLNTLRIACDPTNRAFCTAAHQILILARPCQRTADGPGATGADCTRSEDCAANLYCQEQTGTTAATAKAKKCAPCLLEYRTGYQVRLSSGVKSTDGRPLAPSPGSKTNTADVSFSTQAFSAGQPRPTATTVAAVLGSTSFPLNGVSPQPAVPTGANTFTLQFSGPADNASVSGTCDLGGGVKGACPGKDPAAAIETIVEGCDDGTPAGTAGKKPVPCVQLREGGKYVPARVTLAAPWNTATLSLGPVDPANPCDDAANPCPVGSRCTSGQCPGLKPDTSYKLFAFKSITARETPSGATPTLDADFSLSFRTACGCQVNAECAGKCDLAQGGVCAACESNADCKPVPLGSGFNGVCSAAGPTAGTCQ